MPRAERCGYEGCTAPKIARVGRGLPPLRPEGAELRPNIRKERTSTRLPRALLIRRVYSKAPKFARIGQRRQRGSQRGSTRPAWRYARATGGGCFNKECNYERKERQTRPSLHSPQVGWRLIFLRFAHSAWAKLSFGMKVLTELVTRAMNAVQNHFFGRCPPLTIGWECEGAEFVNVGVSNFWILRQFETV